MPLALVLDGEPIAPDRATFLPLERGLLYGDGLFETMPVERGIALGAARHRERMLASCRALGMPEPPPGAWENGLARCLAGTGAVADVLRVTWTRGPAGARGYAPSESDGPPRLLVAAYQAAPRLVARAALITGLTPGDLARHKTISAMGYVVAAARARALGAGEAILVDDQGRVLEAAGSNVFVVRAGVVSTPPLERPILPGIGRGRAIEALGALEVDISVAELRAADEIFLTNAVAGVVRVAAVDGQPVGDGALGPVTRGLIQSVLDWRTIAAQSS